MSSPKTDIRTQRRRHRGPLIGMAVVVLFGVLLIVYWLFEEAAEADPPAGAEVQIDGRTGEPEAETPMQGVPPASEGVIPPGGDDFGVEETAPVEPVTPEATPPAVDTPPQQQ
ncbi:MAG: hypothetical protein WDA25_06915 [Paracoccaceae bacterium]